MDPSQFFELLSKNLDRSKLRDDTAWIDQLSGFLHAVDWREPAIVALLAFHVAVASLAVAVRGAPNASLVLFLSVCGLVLAARPANDWLGAAGRGRWRRMGFSQNYFDKHGLFAAALFCAPLLLVAFCQMLYALRLASDLLVKVKRREILGARKRAAEGAAAAGGGAGGAAAGAASLGGGGAGGASGAAAAGGADAGAGGGLAADGGGGSGGDGARQRRGAKDAAAAR
jgi:hypothetical protein